MPKISAKLLIAACLLAGGAPAFGEHVGSGDSPATPPPHVKDPAHCRATIKKFLSSRLFTAQGDFAIYHWFSNAGMHYPKIAFDGADLGTRLAKVSRAKISSFETGTRRDVVGQGMYFATDPLISISYGAGDLQEQYASQPQDRMLKDAAMIRFTLKKGSRVVRFYVSDAPHENPDEGLQIPVGKSCAPYTKLDTRNGEHTPLRALYHESLKELHVTAIAYPFLATPYNEGRVSWEAKEPSRKHRFAFNVIDPAYAESADLKGFTFPQLATGETPAAGDSMESLYLKYYRLSEKGQHPRVTNAFEAWSQARVLSMSSFENGFKKATP